MRSAAATVAEYVAGLPADRRKAIAALRSEVKRNLSKGFKEQMNYGMIGYVIPHSVYPDGYHCAPEEPLPFMNIASQKNFIAVYHMGIYADPKLLAWFTAEYAELGIGKLDMGKSCIRFKDPARIPVKLIGALAAKMTAQEWITRYERFRTR